MNMAPGPAERAVCELLEASGLPTSDLQPGHFENFLACGDPCAPGGVVGVEIHGHHGLLRSLAVSRSVRGRGCGRELVAAAEAHARARGVRKLYLLTNTAEAFFEHLGYSHASRQEAPEAIRTSPEFSSLCPHDCAFMVKRMDAPP